jgi:hypothetical protein
MQCPVVSEQQLSSHENNHPNTQHHRRQPMKKCAHCDTPIVDESTMVERDGKTFCCNNCARAMGK